MISDYDWELAQLEIMHLWQENVSLEKEVEEAKNVIQKLEELLDLIP